jgi:polar amino acid transport system substrate-binding protein
MKIPMKSYLKALAVGLAVVVGSAGSSFSDPYQAGVEAAFPPWSYVENGQFKGIAIDAVREIAKEQGFEVEFKDLPWASLIPALSANKIDMLVTGMFATAERDKVIDYAIPWWESNDVVVVPKESKRTVASALCCKARIGTQAGSAHDGWINANLLEGDLATGVTLQTYEDFVAAAEDLKVGRLDSIVMTPDIAEDLIAKGRDLKVVGVIMTNRPWAMAVGQGDPKKLLPKLNKGMVALYKSGKWAEIVHTYLPTAAIPPIPGNMPKELESYASTPPGLE